MAHFPAGLAAQHAGLTHAVGREVVVHEELLPELTLQGIQLLFIIPGAQGDAHQGLGFTAGEDGAAVGAREHAHLNGDGPNLGEGTAVQALAVFQHHAAHDVIFQAVESLINGLLLARELLLELLFHGALDGGALAVPLQLLADAERILEAQRGGFRRHGGLDVFRQHRGGEGGLGLANLGAQLLNGRNDGLAGVVRKHERIHQHVLTQLVRATFHHHNGFFVGGHKQVQVTGGFFCRGGVHNEGTVCLAAHAHAGQRTGLV